MTPLKNPRHEKFAQARARGETADAAYQAAGYKPDRSHAAKLATKSHVVARVQALQSEAVTSTVLSITEKREFIAKLVRADVKTLAADSPLWQELTTTGDGGMRFKLPDKLKAIALDNDLAPDVESPAGVTVVVRIGGQDDGSN